METYNIQVIRISRKNKEREHCRSNIWKDANNFLKLKIPKHKLRNATITKLDKDVEKTISWALRAKMQKTKEKEILNISPLYIIFKQVTVRNIVEFSTEIIAVRRQWNIFKIVKENSCQDRISYPTKHSTKMKKRYFQIIKKREFLSRILTLRYLNTF